jgi:hypothetical protein
MMDKKALKILADTMKKAIKADTYNDMENNWWDAHVYMRHISDEDFAYAKAHSMMFECENISHNAAFERTKAAVQKIDRQDVINAFLFSLSTRRLEYRSAIASYCIGKTTPLHDFTPSASPNELICAICGQHTYVFDEPVDFNPINYFRHGSGVSTEAVDVLFDLEHFYDLPAVKPTAEDYKILNDIKRTIESAKATDHPVQLKKSLAKIIKSNEDERLHLLDILGAIGILHDDTHFGYADEYAPYSKREERNTRFDDFDYPVRWWQGKHGLDHDKWSFWFGGRS